MASNRRPRKVVSRSAASDTPSLRAKFLVLVGEKLSERLKGLPGKHAKTPTSVARERTLIESFLEGFENGKICGQIAQNIDSAIDFLQENDNDPGMQEQCDSVRDAAVKALDVYASNC